MENNTAKEMANNFIDMLRDKFGEKVTDFVIYNSYDGERGTIFSIRFEAYKYFILIMNYDRGRFGCSISYGTEGILLESSQKWYDTANFENYFKDLKEQIELRIPDKFLKANGWI